MIFAGSGNEHYLDYVIDFAIALEDFARSLRDRDRHDRAILTGLDFYMANFDGHSFWCDIYMVDFTAHTQILSRTT